jgi:hypothetical protein
VPDDDGAASAPVVAFAAGVADDGGGGASAPAVAFADGKVGGIPQTCDSVIFTLESLGLHIAAFCSGDSCVWSCCALVILKVPNSNIVLMAIIMEAITNIICRRLELDDFIFLSNINMAHVVFICNTFLTQNKSIIIPCLVDGILFMSIKSLYT